MKKFLTALLMSAMLLTSSIALAAYEESVTEGVDLMTVRRIAVAFPNYYKVEETEPAIDELMQNIYEAGKENSTREIISYAEIASAIRRDTGIDIYKLDVVEAEKVFESNVSKYADSYLVATIANNSVKPWIYYYIYNAADQKLIYTYSIQSRVIDKNTKDYRKSAVNFYKQFENTAAKNLSKEEKKKLEEKKKELRANKNKIDSVTHEKTGKNKADLVKKK